MDKKASLRVLIVGYGGGEITFLNRLVLGLADAGLAVTVTSPKQKKPQLLKHPMVTSLNTPPWEGSLLKRLINLLRLFVSRFSFGRSKWLWEQVRSSDNTEEQLRLLTRYLPFARGTWDVIYFPWNSAAVGYHGLYKLGIPLIISCRGSQVNIKPHLPGQSAYVNLLQESLQKASAVHCVSDDIQHSAQNYGLNPQKSIIIHPAVDPDFFLPAKTKPGNHRLKLLTTGSLIWRKGYEYLLLSMKKLIEKGVDAELEILGDGPMWQKILYSIADMGLEDCVHLHGRLAPRQVLVYLQKADIFVLASLSEGISNAVLEAMSCELPVVTTDCGGMREAVTDGVEGFVVPMRDSGEMAEGLARLASNPSLRERMGKAGRKRVINDFSLDDQVRMFVELFTATSYRKNLD